MRTIPLALLRGDGIGGEVIEAAAQVLESAAHRAGTFAFDFRDYPIGKEAFRSTGKALPDATLAGIREARVALLGALGASADYPSPVGQLRKKLELYADLRPVKSWPGVWSLKPGCSEFC
jgi:isocitrate/isopropylmalate dehydrogenase